MGRYPGSPAHSQRGGPSQAPGHGYKRRVSHQAEAAVGDERLALDQIRAVAAQEDHHVRELFGCSEPVERRALPDGLTNDLVLRKATQGVSVDHAAGYGVHVDTARRELDREMADDALHGGLAYTDGAVERHISVASETRQGDDAAPRFGEQSKRFAREQQQGLRIRAERNVPLRGPHRQERLQPSHRGTVHETVQAGPSDTDASEQLADSVRVADVGRNRLRGAAPGMCLLAGLARGRLLAE